MTFPAFGGVTLRDSGKTTASAVVNRLLKSVLEKVVFAVLGKCAALSLKKLKTN